MQKERASGACKARYGTAGLSCAIVSARMYVVVRKRACMCKNIIACSSVHACGTLKPYWLVASADVLCAKIQLAGVRDCISVAYRQLRSVGYFETRVDCTIAHYCFACL